MGVEYKSKIVRVDLDKGRIETEHLPESTARKYIGGSGLASKILWEETAATTHAFSPENRLCILIGPETGLVPLGSRYSVSAISPLTGLWGEAHAGGHWPDELRRTGFSGVVFQGKASKPAYLYIRDDQVELRDASHLWGKDTYETSEVLRKETDEKACVLCIGQAGENLVPMAAVMNDGLLGRAAARCGLGAVMGSKKLKAVVVRGTNRPKAYNEESLAKSTNEVIRTLSSYRKQRGDLYRWRRAPQQQMGNLAVKNFSLGRFNSFVANVEAIEPTRIVPCRGCPVGCGESSMTDEGRALCSGEAAIPLGSQCLVDDVKVLQEAWQICQRYGMDTISVGMSIAFGMEAYEKGLITIEDTEGIDLRWGNCQAVVELVRQIGEARGFGRVLGQGIKRAAEQIGGAAPEFAMHVKGLELPLHDPRANTSLFIAYATANRGGCHLEAHSHALDRRECRLEETWKPDGTEIGHPPEKVRRLSFEGKAHMVMQMQNLQAMFNSLALCNFLYGWYGVRVATITHWLNCITGWDMDFDEFMRNGERIFNLKRLFNVRRGLTGKDDTIPKRLLSRRPDVDPAVEAVPESLEALIQEYYSLRGWTKEGVPTAAKLAELGLPPP